LAWLWDSAVRPVLGELGLLSLHTKPTRLPRIRWLTSGLLGMTPLHAAGRDWGHSDENTDSHVVSCYISTLKALGYVLEQEKAQLSKRKDGAFLGVAMPTTKGMPDLNDISNRLRSIQDAMSLTGTRSLGILNTPTKFEVLQKLEDCTIVHFACHAESKSDDPSNSCLYLREDSSGQAEALTVRDLSNITLNISQLAYLSACSTAEKSPGRFVDESITIANAFQLLGFSSVVGTLWEADADAADQLVQLFYNSLMRK
ncbi:hypothetical protein BDZ45DRAFT_537922, partial [Acephala macrosclerotiorum]